MVYFLMIFLERIKTVRYQTIVQMLILYNDFIILAAPSGDVVTTEGNVPDEVMSCIDELLAKYNAGIDPNKTEEGFEHCSIEIVRPYDYEQFNYWMLLGRYRRFDHYPLSDSLPSGVIVLDRWLSAIYCNDSSQRLLGLSRDELLGRGWVEAFDETILEELSHYIKESGGFLEPFKKILEVTTPLGKKNILALQFSLRQDINTHKRQFYIVIQDITREYSSLERINYLAQHDALTTLSNREVLMQHIKSQIERKTFNKCLLIYLDINKFKQINDMYGHNAGDHVLRVTAKRLVRSVKRRDVVARVGGDEFVVLMKDVRPTASLATIGEKLYKNLAQKIEYQEQYIDIHMSIGITSGATYEKTLKGLGEELQSQEVLIDEWIRSADIVMDEAKKSENVGYVIFEENYHRLQLEEKKQFEHLKDEIANESSYRLFQPIMKDGKIYSVEALSRFQFENNIEHIIDLAFRNHFAKTLFDHLLYACLSDFKRLLTQLLSIRPCLSALKLNVNIDILQLEDETFAQKLKSFVDSLKLVPANIYLEITEKVLESNQHIVNEQLELLKVLGFRLSIDDFGTGYNSIQRLIRYEFDQIKLDRSFFSGVEQHTKLQAALKAASHLGQSLDMEVLGEGVENELELEYAHINNIQVIQGYLYSKPLNESELINFAGQLNSAYIHASGENNCEY